MTSLTALLLALLVGGVGTPSGAASSQPLAEDGGQLLVIMDVSGSMERIDSSGTTLIEGARAAVRQLMGELPADAQVGLRLYGSEYAGDVKSKGCTDTELAVPIGAASATAEQITKAIDGARPTGFTPIGAALTEAASDFDTDVERSIVLVSDGEDTCGTPPPCEAAKQLSRAGIKVRVDTVGLFLQDAPRAAQQLRCIAKETGGSYVGADDTAALAEELTTVSTRAINRFQADGEAITGGTSLVTATPMEPGTTYLNGVVKGEAQWFSFEAEAGQSVRLTATDDGTVDYGCCLTWTVHDLDGDRWGSDHGYSSGSANTYVVDGSSPLNESGTYYVSAELSDTTQDAKYGEVASQFVLELSGTPTETATPTDSATPTETATPSEEATPTEGVDDADSAPAEQDGNTVLWALVGVLGLAVLGLGAAVLVLLRRTGRAS